MRYTITIRGDNHDDIIMEIDNPRLDIQRRAMNYYKGVQV